MFSGRQRLGGAILLAARTGVTVSVLVIVIALVSTLKSEDPPITVEWNSPRQVIDGFGGSVTGYSEAFSSARADRFFSAQTGLGLSLLRIRPIAETLPEDCGCVSNSDPHHCFVGTHSQILTGDLQIAQAAAQRGVTLLAAPWSPPAAMKSSGKYCSSGAMIGNSSNYANYAADLSDFQKLLQAHGLSIVALSIQNEPDIKNDSYDTCTWTDQQIHDFVPYLSDALSSAGFSNIKIALPEQSTWTFDLANKSLRDPATAAKVGIVFGHAYASANPKTLPSVETRHVWQTEVSGPEAYNGSMKDALMWAEYIHNYMSIGANAWMYWSLDCGPRAFNSDNNMCLTNHKGDFAKRAYALGQFAKFVRPGWQRINVTNNDSLLVTAYEGPHNEFAIVAINKSRWVARNQSFTFDGAPGKVSKVTPWITSASASLAAQPALPIDSTGTAFSYTIPPESVVTFQGRVD